MGCASFQNGEAGSVSNVTSFAACTASMTGVSAASATALPSIRTATVLAKPFIDMLPHKVVVLQVWIKPAYAINFFHLPRGEDLFTARPALCPTPARPK